MILNFPKRGHVYVLLTPLLLTGVCHSGSTRPLFEALGIPWPGPENDYADPGPQTIFIPAGTEIVFGRISLRQKTHWNIDGTKDTITLKIRRSPDARLKSKSLYVSARQLDGLEIAERVKVPTPVDGM